jgi:hypothetical protein
LEEDRRRAGPKCPACRGLFREQEKDMKSFSNDSDILRYEPILFSDLYVRVNLLASGSGGVVSGTSFTAASASFITAGVEAGGVISLSNAAGTIGGLYEIVSVDSATQLTVSVLRDERGGLAKAPPQASDVSYRVVSYGPQSNDVFVRFCEHFRITAGQAATIPNTAGLREASVYLTIATVFAVIATREGFAQGYLNKSDQYTDRFIEAIERCRFVVEIDGKVVTRRGGEIRLERQ